MRKTDLYAIDESIPGALEDGEIIMVTRVCEDVGDAGLHDDSVG